MSEFWWTLGMLALGGAAGGIVGYHAGLARSAEAIYDALKWKDDREALNKPPPPAREAAINDCINAVFAVRPVLPEKGQLSQMDFMVAMAMTEGVDAALEALRRIDKRGAGVYGVPRDLMEWRSRAALDKEAAKENEAGT